MSTVSCRLINMNTNTATQKMYTVKITAGFERNVSYMGRYETKAEAIAAARYMESEGIGGGRYCVAVPAA